MYSKSVSVLFLLTCGLFLGKALADDYLEGFPGNLENSSVEGYSLSNVTLNYAIQDVTKDGVESKAVAIDTKPLNTNQSMLTLHNFEIEKQDTLKEYPRVNLLQVCFIGKLNKTEDFLLKTFQECVDCSVTSTENVTSVSCNGLNQFDLNSGTTIALKSFRQKGELFLFSPITVIELPIPSSTQKSTKLRSLDIVTIHPVKYTELKIYFEDVAQPTPKPKGGAASLSVSLIVLLLGVVCYFF